MDKHRRKIDAPVRRFAADRRREQEGHPSVEELVAYRQGELDPETHDLLQDHLALCGECSRLLLDLEDFPELEAPSEAHRLSDRDVDEARRALEARLRDGDPPGRVIRFPASGKPPAKSG